MKSTVLKLDKRVAFTNDKSLNIQSYGETNAYPQEIMQLVNASGTGKSCVAVYTKFINGRGFVDALTQQIIVNRNRQTLGDILTLISHDLALFGGFALHLNYNANLRISEVQYMPFETLRFDKLDDNGHFSQIKYHPDWAKQLTRLRKWSKDDIVSFDPFDPDPQTLQAKIDAAQGIENYNGQIYYYSNEGPKTYPLPIFDPVITDMNTEEGIANVSNRNARNNFLLSGALVDIKNQSQSEDQESDLAQSLVEFQGDENACKMMVITVDSKEDVPQVLNFSSKTYDKEFQVTLQAAQTNIGKAFNQPPILRSEDVGANFGADLMNNAYNFYNSVTENERRTLSASLDSIFSYWNQDLDTDFQIDPLSYQMEMTLAQKLGNDNLSQLLAIAGNTTLPVTTRRSMAKTLFQLSPQQLDDILPLTNPQTPQQ